MFFRLAEQYRAVVLDLVLSLQKLTEGSEVTANSMKPLAAAAKAAVAEPAGATN
ncbi:MAG: hypothetical protein ACKOCI_01935 [Cyanobium sp.]